LLNLIGPDFKILFFLIDFKMTVVEAYFGGKKMDSPDNAQMLSADVTSLIVEGIAQNTSGSIFEPEVSHLHSWRKNKHMWLRMHLIFQWHHHHWFG
jgi:hypothetical protein